MKFLKLAVIILILSSCNNNQPKNTSKEVLNPKLEFVWETDTLLTTCESALYDSKTGIIYVSNINNNPWDIDSNGFISTIDTTGKILNLKWLESGLSGPKGMGMYNGKLYVNDIDRIVEIDIQNQKILNSYHVAGNPRLNDITVSKDGTVYSSGTSSNTIYALHNGKIDSLFTNEVFNRLNGLLHTDEGLYYMSSGNEHFGIYDFKSNSSKILTEGLGNGDGIVSVKNGFIVSDWKGQVFYINSSDWSKQKLLDTRSKEIYSADIEYITEHSLLLVPTFFENKVVCYRVKF